MFVYEDIYFPFLPPPPQKKPPCNPYPNWGPSETPRDNNSHTVSNLSLNVQESFFVTVSCRLQENIQLEAHFLVGVRIDPRKKKKNKTEQKQRSTNEKLLVAESAVKWNVPEES